MILEDTSVSMTVLCRNSNNIVVLGKLEYALSMSSYYFTIETSTGTAVVEIGGLNKTPRAHFADLCLFDLLCLSLGCLCNPRIVCYLVLILQQKLTVI